MPASIRWDRLSRYGLLVVLASLTLLYVGPATSFVSTWRESHRRAGDVRALEHANRQLREKQKVLRDPRTAETEARRYGLVKPGEQSYVVTGLPKGR